jgi:hypothetical protein
MRTVPQPRAARQENDAPLVDAVPATLVARLSQHGVHSIKDWRALGRKRRLIWGVTRRMVAELDALARGAR